MIKSAKPHRIHIIANTIETKIHSSIYIFSTFTALALSLHLPSNIRFSFRSPFIYLNKSFIEKSHTSRFNYIIE